MTNRAGCDTIPNCYIGAFDRKGDVMSEKRKDNKGRLLRTGESQRKDLTYMYRYKDNDGTRRSVYAPTLSELRDKEDEIVDKLSTGIIIGKNPTGKALLETFLKMKVGIRPSTHNTYCYIVKAFQDDPVSDIPVRDLTKTAMKEFFVSRYQAGATYGTLKLLKAILRQAYGQAVEDGAVEKNPCDFTLSHLIPKSSTEKVPLTEDQLIEFLEFAKYSQYNDYYIQLMVLAHTGMRVSESCALTVADVDFESGLLRVCKQVSYLQEDGHAQRKIVAPKTQSSYRYIPIDGELRDVLRIAVREAKSRKVDLMVDGYHGFLFLRSEGSVRVAKDVEGRIQQIVRDYNRAYKKPLPHITPHTLRHTFCTKSISCGVDPKSVQYVMGHSTSKITMDVYTHASQEQVVQSYTRAFGS